jgi:hypothetical protein
MLNICSDICFDFEGRSKKVESKRPSQAEYMGGRLAHQEGSGYS